MVIGLRKQRKNRLPSDQPVGGWWPEKRGCRHASRYKGRSMARRGDSVIGIDLGKRVFKGVTLQRRSDSRFVLTSYASREVPEKMSSADELAQQIKLLVRELGGAAKGCAIAVSDPTSLLRIVEQPDTPVNLLRNALRLN